MISPHTPPGTDVVCINDAPGPYGNGGIVKGNVYTVEAIHKSDVNRTFVATLVGIPVMQGYHPAFGLMNVGFELGRFRYLVIPKSLTDLLEQAPVSRTKQRELENV